MQVIIYTLPISIRNHAQNKCLNKNIILFKQFN